MHTTSTRATMFTQVTMGLAFSIAAFAGTVVTTAVAGAEPDSDLPVIADVDPADYAQPGIDDYYWWTNPDGRACAASSTGVYCSVIFPDGTPEVSTDGFSGPPNSIRLTVDGTEARIGESGRPGAPALEAGYRIQFGDLSCTAAADGVACEGPGGGFSFLGGVLTRYGTEISAN
ncbi:MAG: hypothetical protein QM809_05765 [Gordonia sp. (in: high G+C Gram-positive bacteria)]|uniref:hypothetical protein n=1 Tax=Gordonia sp. (in: high G+C Gram-positive bacteria) TaxID=84139 RepID=UPI0039E40813